MENKSYKFDCPYWLWPNVLSLDAPLIAIIWQEGFAVSLGVELGWINRVILGLYTWLAYCGDRILDGRRLQSSVSSVRHEFARIHWKSLTKVWFLVLGLTIFLTTKLNLIELVYGALFGVFIGVYFLLQHHPLTRIKAGKYKEFLAGIGFASGTVLFLFVRVDLTALFFLMFILWALLCVVNCLIISVKEITLDKEMGQSSQARNWPKLGRLIPGVLICLILFSLTVCFLDNRWILLSLCFCLSCGGLVQLCRRSSGCGSPLFRVLTDAVLLSPLIFIV